MRVIEGLEEAIKQLEPHWPLINKWFDKENEQFKKLLAHNHDYIGRILKCHLIVENYMTNYLIAKYRIDNINDAKLSFFQKASLLPSQHSQLTFIRPGIFEMNSVRNKYGHRIDAKLNFNDIDSIMEVLKISQHGRTFPDPVQAIEAFTPVACAFMLVTPVEFEVIFDNAFKSIRHLAG